MEDEMENLQRDLDAVEVELEKERQVNKGE